MTGRFVRVVRSEVCAGGNEEGRFVRVLMLILMLMRDGERKRLIYV